ncbi:hypothetical protein [Kushneria indalinina]|uniref:Uncharacterized protein n=1 Tax=Kushneria indalinina DSM 14324 TaxID=1122140 RepID=A0A3D9DXK2_9GAMM|nr:hypothetical protein [Kushneria indalinina]REC95089.1 hypothetical protein C8D72_1924 [Kushneria indalinina DSM 14324]
MSSVRSSNPVAMVMLVASAIGIAIALHAYLTPLTGVTGTLGALIVIVTCAVLVVLALGLVLCRGRVLHNLLRIVTVAVIVGTAFAALLLHLWWLAIAMAVALVGWMIDIFRAAPAHRTHS